MGNTMGMSKKDLEKLVEETNLTRDQLQSMFKTHNFKKHKKLTLDELTEAMKKDLGLSTPDDLALVKRLFFLFDVDSSGSIDFNEFAAGTALLQSGSKEDKLYFIFQCIDLDGSGEITQEELTSIVRSLQKNPAAQEALCLHIDPNVSVPKYVDEFFHQADLDRSGSVSFGEFNRFILNYSSKHFNTAAASRIDPKPFQVETVATQVEKSRAGPSMVILGPPCYEVQSLVQRFSDKFNLKQIHPDKMTDTDVLFLKQEYSKKGRTIQPDEFTSLYIEYQLYQPQVQEQGWLLEGFPSTKDEAMYWNQMGLTPDRIVRLIIPDEEIISNAEQRIRHEPIEDLKARLAKYDRHIIAIMSLLEPITEVDISSTANVDVMSQMQELLEDIGSNRTKTVTRKFSLGVQL
eukprot:TRINITY_DN15425_c0_g1_i1.p1 TRINITY_DN15425_c0_g1~~TRINITY_DN15425_c0_g1_i1.p1  ORF type:complete len:404 (+),score=132.00 TRINITY_DN15425_c0_g1_i1:106-1317(+)